MKSALICLLALIAVEGFSPKPAFRALSSTTTTTSNTIRFMDPPVLDEEKVDEAVSENVEAVEEKEEEKEELSETQKLMKQVKEAGTAGVISYALWELGFWALSVPVCVFGYREVTGHWPDFNNAEDMQKLGAEAFAFVNFARFAVPLRIGLALSTTPWIQDNVVDRFMKKNEDAEE